jgi:hypothetical protein
VLNIVLSGILRTANSPDNSFEEADGARILFGLRVLFANHDMALRTFRGGGRKTFVVVSFGNKRRGE